MFEVSRVKEKHRIKNDILYDLILIDISFTLSRFIIKIFILTSAEIYQ